MKPFNLERALAGDPVVTRNGEAVTQITLFAAETSCPIRAVLSGTIRAFSVDGKAEISRYDLFMVPKKKARWINVYKHTGFETKEEADLIAMDTRVACVKVEWEE